MATNASSPQQKAPQVSSSSSGTLYVEPEQLAESTNAQEAAAEALDFLRERADKDRATSSSKED